MTVATDLHHNADSRIATIDGVSWDTYEALLRDFEKTGQNKRVTYDRGRMVIVSPLPKHEKWKSLIGRFVEAIAEAKGIPISTFGSTTWKRKELQQGLEADDCFYIQHEAQVRGRLDLNVNRDPPPDLAIEIDVRSPDVERLDIYAALGINEVWRFDGERIESFVLNAKGDFDAVETSASFPFLKPADLKQFIDLFGQIDQGSIIRRVRLWAEAL